jgi:aspartate racemase
VKPPAVIGLLGGMSWESSAEYYRIINQEIMRRTGGAHSARCVMVSLDFGEVAPLQHEGRWDDLAALMADSARRLERSGADMVVLCTNTMHRLAGAIEEAVSIPPVHIADATAQAVKAAGLGRVGLLGTAFTMEQDFYKGRLSQRHGLDVLVPSAEDRADVHRVIYEELIKGAVLPASRQRYREVMQRLVDRGAEGVILGCTEIGLLVAAADCAAPLFDTTRLHALAAVDKSLG